MRQLLGLLSYRGRFHPNKSLPYLAKWPSSDRGRTHPRPPSLLPSHQGGAQPAGTSGGLQSRGNKGSKVALSLSVTSILNGGHQNDMPAMTHIPAASEYNSTTRNRISGDSLPVRRKALATERRNKPIKESHYRGTHLALTSENLHGSQALKNRINEDLFSLINSRQ